MPRKIGPRAGKKRTKTFSGCWTCRARGVKCDTVQPSCNRCKKAKRVCEGYGIRLIWDRPCDSEEKQVKGRLLFSKSDMIHPTFTDEEIDSALELLDTEKIEQSFVRQAGPFCVFKSDVSDEIAEGSLDEETDWSDSTSALASFDAVSYSSLCFSQDHEYDSSCSQIFDTTIDTGNLDIIEVTDHSESSTPSNSWTCDEAYQTSMTTKQKLYPLLQPFISSSTQEERQLFHFWVTSVSNLMISTGHPDNPFRRVIIPLAMAATTPWEHNTLNKALLHSIYALTSFNVALLHDQKERRLTAIRHQEFSLRLLRSSLSEDMAKHRSAFLATIVILSTIECITGQYSEWRIHVEAGRGWLRSLEKSWIMTDDERIMYQLFQLLEALGNTYRPKSLNLITESTENESYAVMPLQTNTLETVDEGTTFYAERLYGITKPVFEMIIEINNIATRPTPITKTELLQLERKLLLSNPSTLRFPSSTPSIERLTRHHACAFHIGCNIHYSRTLLHQDSSDLQHLVEQGLYHLTTVNELEAENNVAGLLWPAYVIACEAEGEDSRGKALGLFERRCRQGIGGAANVQAMVLEVWWRRDNRGEGEEGEGDGGNTSLGILQSLGIDLLLV